MCKEEVRMLKIINKDRRRRSFRMSIGLIEGYSGSKLHTLQEAEQIIMDWSALQLASEKVYLPGRFDYNRMLYAHHNKAVAEETAVYEGEVSPLYNSKISDKKVTATLIELATLLAKKLKQTRIYLTYRDKIFILEDSAKKMNIK
jgi:hypothetical protein